MLFSSIVLLLLAWLTVTALLVGWTWIWLSRRGSSVALRLACAFAILIGTAALLAGDHILGALQFDQSCESQSGLKIFKKVSGAESFRSPFASHDTPAAYGFAFVERINGDGTVTRFTRGADGRTVEEARAVPKARYIVDQTTDRLGAQVSRTQYVITDAETKERIAQYVVLGYQGGWLVRQFQGANPPARICPREPFNYRNFVVGVLQPKS